MNEVEASILLDEMNQFTIAKNWPTANWGPQDLSQTCIVSPSRPTQGNWGCVTVYKVYCELIDSACVPINN